MRRQRRPGFTLLEIMLATAIGVLLLFALYTAFNAQLRHVDAGRDAVEQSVLARAVLARIANDISSSLAPVPPPAKSSSGQGSSGGSAASTTTTTGGLSTVQFNLGLQGDTNSLALYVSRWPRELTGMPAGAAPPLVSDLRRVSYWLVSGKGLARQELKLATSDEALGGMADSLDEASLILAEEVRSLEFRYFDGTSWQDTWDGTTQGGSSGATIGPPQAVEIKIGFAPAGMRPSTDMAAMEPAIKYYRHVVAIPTANGPDTGQ